MMSRRISQGHSPTRGTPLQILSPNHTPDTLSGGKALGNQGTFLGNKPNGMGFGGMAPGSNQGAGTFGAQQTTTYGTPMAPGERIGQQKRPSESPYISQTSPAFTSYTVNPYTANQQGTPTKQSVGGKLSSVTEETNSSKRQRSGRTVLINPEERISQEYIGERENQLNGVLVKVDEASAKAREMQEHALEARKMAEETYAETRLIMEDFIRKWNQGL